MGLISEMLIVIKKNHKSEKDIQRIIENSCRKNKHHKIIQPDLMSLISEYLKMADKEL